MSSSLPADFGKLRDEARLEGFNHIERLARDWEQETFRFDRPGENLLAACIDRELAGIGGLTIDPHDERLLRMRRFYVRPQFRRQGIGRSLMKTLSIGVSCDVVVNAPEDAQLFWQAMGFAPDSRVGHTHIM